MIFNMTGGAPLNFSVTAYASDLLLPASARENTIAVITSTPVNGYVFSNETPANPVEGQVWMKVGAASAVPFNALKNETLMVYPASAQQYINGTWTKVSVLIYQNGVWDRFITWVYDRGDKCEGVTGGWNTLAKCYFEDTRIYFDGNQSGTVQATAETKKAINITPYDKMVVIGEVFGNYNDSWCFDTSGLRKLGNSSLSATWAHGTIGKFEKVVDISNLSGEFFVHIKVGISVSIKAAIYEVYFE